MVKTTSDFGVFKDFNSAVKSEPSLEVAGGMSFHSSVSFCQSILTETASLVDNFLKKVKKQVVEATPLLLKLQPPEVCNDSSVSCSLDMRKQIALFMAQRHHISA